MGHDSYLRRLARMGSVELTEAAQPRKPATYFPQAGHRAYEPTESEICEAARQIQDHWTDKERRSRGYTPGPGVDGPGIRVIEEAGIGTH